MNKKKQKSETYNRQFWNVNETEQLILLYENWPCLYDVSSKDYHNKMKRTAALNSIQRSLCELFPNKEFTMDLVQKKIHGLRAQFTNELNKIKKSEASGTSTDHIYKPTLWCFDMLSFLHTYSIIIQGDSNLQIEKHNDQKEAKQASSQESSLSLDENTLETRYEVEEDTQESWQEISEEPTDVTDGECIEIVYENDISDPKCSNHSEIGKAAPIITPKKAPTSQSSNNNKQKRKIDEVCTPTSAPKKKHKLKDQDILNIIDKSADALTSLCAKKDENSQKEILQEISKGNSFTDYLASEMEKIEDESVLDAFKENVLSELFQAKKAMRQIYKKK